MNRKKILVILRRAVLLLLIATLFWGVSKVLERKTVYGAWNYSLKVNGFTNEPEESMDIIGYGSSHMYCTLNPISIYEDFGLRSYVFLTNSNPNSLYQISYENVEEEAILPQFEETFLDIVELAKQKDTEVLLLVAPYNITEAELRRYKYLSRIAQENGVKVLDMNLELNATGLNNDTDYYDPGHLNAYGSEKASAYIVNYIKDNYDITPNDVDDDALWQSLL